MPSREILDATAQATGQGGVPEASIVTATILTALATADVRRVLDIGCGRGDLAAALLRRGFAVTGVDPSAQALAAARSRAPGAEFLLAGADSIPARSGSFGAAVFVNSLHHLPGGGMETGLSEAWRLLRPGGILVVVEPLAEGSFFAAMKRVDDETAIRAEALAALAAFAASTPCQVVADSRFDRVSRFASVDAFVTFLCAADPDRRRVVEADPDAVVRDFQTCADRPEIAGDRPPWQLTQPHVLRVLRKPGA